MLIYPLMYKICFLKGFLLVLFLQIQMVVLYLSGKKMKQEKDPIQPLG